MSCAGVAPRRTVRFAVAIAWTCASAAMLMFAVVGCSRPSSSPVAPTPTQPVAGERFPVVIRKPAGPPTIPTGTFDEKGRPVVIACATCHATKPVNSEAYLGKSLVLFHQGLAGHHARLACIACHNSADGYATLHLADNSSLPYPEVMMLCAQCHGPQYRDYQHGAHGGMTGHWDLSQGGRIRNNCIDCHDAHAPRFPVLAPARGPNDRFQSPGSSHD